MNHDLSQALAEIETQLDSLAGDMEADCTADDAATASSYIAALRAQLDRIEAAASVVAV